MNYLVIAQLWAKHIEAGNRQYYQVPKVLRETVAEILIADGCEQLVTN